MTSFPPPPPRLSFGKPPRSVRRRGAPIRSALLLAVSAVTAPPAEAQVFLPDPVEETAFLVQWEKPFIPELEGLSFYSSVLELDVVVPLRGGLSLQIGAPLAVAGADQADETSVVLGNVRSSLLFGEPGAIDGFVGITLPTASELTNAPFAQLIGLLTHLDRMETWVDDAVSVRGAVIPSWALDGGGRVGLRLGGAVVAPTEFDDMNVFARVAGWGRFPSGAVELRSDLSASYLVNDDDGFGEQTLLYLDLGADLHQASGRPGVFVRIPLDGDAREVLDLVVGLRFAF